MKNEKKTLKYEIQTLKTAVKVTVNGHAASSMVSKLFMRWMLECGVEVSNSIVILFDSDIIAVAYCISKRDKTNDTRRTTNVKEHFLWKLICVKSKIRYIESRSKVYVNNYLSKHTLDVCIWSVKSNFRNIITISISHRNIFNQFKTLIPNFLNHLK